MPLNRRPGVYSTFSSEPAPQLYKLFGFDSDPSSLCARHWTARPVEYPPALPVPDKPDAVFFDVTQRKFVRSEGKVTPDDEAYMFLCNLCRIDSETLIILRDPEITKPPPPAFTLSKYKKLLDFIESLPESVKHVDNAPGAVLHFQ